MEMEFWKARKKPIWMVMIEKIIERHEKTIHGIWHGPQHTRRWHCTQCVLIPNETRNMYFFFSFENQMVFIQNIYLVDGTSNSNQAAIKLLRHATRNEFTQFFLSACFCSPSQSCFTNRSNAADKFITFEINVVAVCTRLCSHFSEWIKVNIKAIKGNRTKPHEMMPKMLHNQMEAHTKSRR